MTAAIESSAFANPNAPASPERPALLGRDLNEIVALTQRGGFQAYRGKQLFHWLYQRGIASFDEAHNLPADYRRFLSDNYEVGLPAIERLQGDPASTQKILFSLRDGKRIESVLMRETEGPPGALPKGRSSLCVSTQVGCPLDCVFCLTGVGGFQRNLSAGEIVGQVLAGRRLMPQGQILNNMVFMGMGEPLLNLEAVVPALRLIISPQAVGFSSRRITLSTAGVAPAIGELGAAGLYVSLAVSLNATTDEVRSRLMPINRKYPIAQLLAACRAFPLPNRRRITFEYVLLRGVNDSDADARRLAQMVRSIPCKINLIVFNPHEALPFQPSTEERIQVFGAILRQARYTVAVRHSKGRELQAACGQLAGHVAEEDLRRAISKWGRTLPAPRSAR